MSALRGEPGYYLSGMPDEFTGSNVCGLATFGRAHNVEHARRGIDDKVIDDAAHAGKLLRNLGSGTSLPGAPHGAAEADNAKLGIDAYGQIARALILAKGMSNLGRQGIIANQIILNLQKTLNSRNLIAGQFAAQSAGNVTLHIENAIEDPHTHA